MISTWLRNPRRKWALIWENHLLINGGIPNSWLLYFMENPINGWWLGVPLFQETTIYIYIYIYIHISIILWLVYMYIYISLYISIYLYIYIKPMGMISICILPMRGLWYIYIWKANGMIVIYCNISIYYVILDDIYPKPMWRINRIFSEYPEKSTNCFSWN